MPMPRVLPRGSKHASSTLIRRLLPGRRRVPKVGAGAKVAQRLQWMRCVTRSRGVTAQQKHGALRIASQRPITAHRQECKMPRDSQHGKHARVSREKITMLVPQGRLGIRLSVFAIASMPNRLRSYCTPLHSVCPLPLLSDVVRWEKAIYRCRPAISRPSRCSRYGRMSTEASKYACCLALARYAAAHLSKHRILSLEPFGHPPAAAQTSQAMVQGLRSQDVAGIHAAGHPVCVSTKDGSPATRRSQMKG
jgi:hypothetical protein